MGAATHCHFSHFAPPPPLKVIWMESDRGAGAWQSHMCITSLKKKVGWSQQFPQTTGLAVITLWHCLASITKCGTALSADSSWSCTLLGPSLPCTLVCPWAKTLKPPRNASETIQHEVLTVIIFNMEHKWIHEIQ